MRTRISSLSLLSVICLASGSAQGQPSTNRSMSISGSGSGFFVSYDGKILTNNHVIEDCSAIKIDRGCYLANDAFLVGRDMNNDLALLQSSQSSLKPNTIPGLRSQVRLGETIYVHGFPVPPILSSLGNFTVGFRFSSASRVGIARSLFRSPSATWVTPLKSFCLDSLSEHDPCAPKCF